MATPTIYERVHARSDLDALRAARDITALSEALNAEGATEYAQKFVSARIILTSCPDGVAILAALSAAVSNVAVSWALKFLGQDSGLDIGDPGIDPLLDGLVAGGVLTAPWRTQLKALALRPLTVTQEQVGIALYNDDGTEK